MSVNIYGQIFKGTVIFADAANDLSIIQTDINPRSVFSFNSDNPYLLEEVYVAGFPFGETISSSVKVTSGIISSLTGPNNNTSLIQIDAALQVGNSGGPIVNKSGNIIGVAVAKLDYETILDTFGVLPENTNFGIKSSVVKNVLQSNNIKFKINNNYPLETKDLSDLISNGTIFLTCWK